MDLSSPTDFVAALAATAGTAMLFIGGGVTAGLTIFAGIFGVRKGIAALKTVGK